MLKAVVSMLAAVLLNSSISVPETSDAVLEGKEEAEEEGIVQRGELLVLRANCHMCHSPKVFTPIGVFPDDTRLLSGHPEDEKLPEVPPNLIGPGKWFGLFTVDQTAWAGPWGVVFAANLTPDPGTGIGDWTEETFIKVMRSGRHKGFGREILPPMPWEDYAGLRDEDLKAIFTYLRTLDPVKNKVPDPIPPPER